MSRKHWSERTGCICGASFNVGSMAEARHRHNFPALCRKRKPKPSRSLATVPVAVVPKLSPSGEL